ncbi:hypothetical protein A3842_03925 [Paenibacillus sp. P3E]|uniref:hypothetical protein n=1 Tax=unclassified Paenibacillus TaxID=185978 RepID=UPI00093E8A82|nr:MULTISPECIES: hypothetical protein [unclassified Paenibacillus]OKP90035.1 hypothetical protein A3842_03925 [Paenibacillus sp. P3E]OKP93957.1 hypothetical protein A3848_02675 [Paenibacillus sp. P32E]
MATALNSFEITNIQVETALNENAFRLESTSTIDEVKARIADYCKENLAVGNERDARVEELSLNGTVVNLKVWIRSKHKVFAGVTLYSVTYEINGTYDLINPTIVGESEICVDTPAGKQCIKAKQIVAILMALL